MGPAELQPHSELGICGCCLSCLEAAPHLMLLPRIDPEAQPLVVLAWTRPQVGPASLGRARTAGYFLLVPKRSTVGEVSGVQCGLGLAQATSWLSTSTRAHPGRQPWVLPLGRDRLR